jgi:hypothetical protein
MDAAQKLLDRLPPSPMCFISACQSGDKRIDFVPGFARHDQLTFLDLGRGEIQSGRNCIRDNRESGDAARSLEAPRFTLDRLGFNTGAIEFLPDVSKELEPTQLE